MSNVDTAAELDGGTVTFQVKDGATDVGSAVVDSSIINGVASVTYTLPAGTAAGDYTIVATYSGTANFYGSFDNTATLTVAKRLTSTSAANQTSTYSEQGVNVTLTATVSATASTVNAGTVTFQLKDGATDVGSAVVDSSIINGVASVTYTLPAGTAAGDYTIVATYSGTANFYGSFDNTATLTVAKRLTSTSAANQTSTYSEQGVNVTLTATVSATASTVNAGTVTFQLKNGATDVGSARRRQLDHQRRRQRDLHAAGRDGRRRLHDRRDLQRHGQLLWQLRQHGHPDRRQAADLPTSAANQTSTYPSRA